MAGSMRVCFAVCQHLLALKVTHNIRGDILLKLRSDSGPTCSDPPTLGLLADVIFQARVISSPGCRGNGAGLRQQTGRACDG